MISAFPQPFGAEPKLHRRCALPAHSKTWRGLRLFLESLLSIFACIGTMNLEQVRRHRQRTAGILPAVLFSDWSAGKMPAALWGAWEELPLPQSGALRRTPLQRAFEDFTQLFRSEFDRIGLHAACLQGRRDNRRRVVGGDSITMERQDFQVRTEVLHPDNSFGGAHAITADEQPCDVVVTTQRLA